MPRPLTQPPLRNPGQLRDLSLRHPVRAKDGDNRPQIPPSARGKNILPRENPLHDPAHLRNVQAHGAIPVPWAAGQPQMAASPI
jgi:hypothetical protein